MKKQSIAIAGFLHAAAATAYVGFVAFLMTHASVWLGEKDTKITPMAVLMLLVLSAAVMGSLTFLRPLLWYIDGKKKEAVHLLGWMIGFLFILTLIVFVVAATVR